MLCLPQTSCASICNGNRLACADYDRAGWLRMERSDLTVQIGLRMPKTVFINDRDFFWPSSLFLRRSSLFFENFSLFRE
jgi:hypothetical protein